MFKVVKILVLLAILACIAVGAYMYARPKPATTPGGPAEISSQDKAERSGVEEPYGFTSEGVNP
ncbi:MAG: hypothetical protein PVJ57_00550 [Phycisphaerae bacterium]|jgi:hypothetical protein